MKQDATESEKVAPEEPDTGPAILSRKRYPYLHAILHRYGIPEGTSVSAQRNAREELERLLWEARELGRREERTARADFIGDVPPPSERGSRPQLRSWQRKGSP